jgi:FGGY-family pentulose kinase
MMQNYFIGIDVGTGSARAGVFDSSGKMLGMAVHPIQIWKYQEVFVEQSSADIWSACCKVVREAVDNASIKPEQIKGIGFDATCSLVVLDKDDQPVAVNADGENARNIIVWMDHRATEQAKRINATKHKVLDYVGGKISPEMQTPKLLWLKENLPDVWKRAAHFFDLPDFLVYRATESNIRSLCSLVCKWTYMGHLHAWDDSYFQQIGLGDLVAEKYARIGTQVWAIGESVAKGLSAKAAKELGLLPGTAVGVSAIDAHAGGIGLLGAKLKQDKLDLTKRIALISGTSSCYMAVSSQPNFVPGVWGPYFSAMIPDMWLAEGGQSVTGALIDHIIFSNVLAAELQQQAQRADQSIYEILRVKLEKLAKKVKFPAALTKELHVLPDFHGNRSPRANPDAKGMISGLTLSNSEDELALLYFATIQAIGYGAKHIIETLNEHDSAINTIFICGGGANNPLLLQEHADITGCPIVLPKEKEAVLLGSAILGAVAAKKFDSIIDAMTAMSGAEKIISPTENKKIINYHAKKYQIFLEMYQDQMKYKSMLYLMK